MKYLLPIEYTRFIYYTIINELDVEQTSFFFLFQYKKNIVQNPDFINELKKSIDLIDKKRKKIKKESNADLKLNGSDCNIDTDVINGKIPFDSLHYQTEFINGNWEAVSEFSEEAILSNEKLTILKEGLKLFISRAEDNLPDNEELIINKKIKERTANKSIKIRWEGTQSQLYYEFRVLKENELILNNYDEIAEFIKENFTGFEKTSLNTIRTEIKRKINIVKPKRIQKPDEI